MCVIKVIVLNRMKYKVNLLRLEATVFFYYRSTVECDSGVVVLIIVGLVW